MSALGEKLMNHSLAMPKTESPLFLAALDFFKKSGGRARAHEIIDRAYERVKPNDDAGISIDVSDKDQPDYFPASSPQANGSGQSISARPRHLGHATPVRTPLDLTGAIAYGMKKVLAQSVFDRIKTSDGRAWGNVGAHELDGMARDGAFAKALKNKIGTLSNAQRFMTVRELISVDKFEQARNEANGS
jgi:hypothetical protein